jgi:hypothetical protein
VSEVDQATAAYVRLANAQALARDRGREGGLVGGGDTSGLTQAQRDRLAAEEAARFQTELQDRIIERTGTTTQRLALVNAELAKARPLSEEAMALEVERAQLNQQLANEQEALADRAASTAASAAKKAASEAKQLADQEQRERERRQSEVEQALDRIEDRTTDHYRRLRQAQEDYALSSSRREEDYQRERQRLLAEGRIAEAKQLAEEFAREQRRAAEDQARARSRQTEDVSGDIARIREDAQLDPRAQARQFMRHAAADAASGAGDPVHLAGKQAGAEHALEVRRGRGGVGHGAIRADGGPH